MACNGAEVAITLFWMVPWLLVQRQRLYMQEVQVYCSPCDMLRDMILCN